VASTWIIRRPRKDGGASYRVLFRVGGRESTAQYAGAFSTKTEALKRKGWVAGELAARRVPDFSALVEPVAALTLPEAMRAWRASRVDVELHTAYMHRSAEVRIFKVAPELRRRRVDEITVDECVALVAALTKQGYKRETIRKTRTALAQTLEHHGITPNPARDKRVKLPKERKAHIPPPIADHVERVAETVARKYVLPLLILEACGPRASELATALMGDLDEDRSSIRIRPTNEKNERYRSLRLPDVLFAALLETLPPREDRDLEAPLFGELTDANIRTAITRACKATGTPHYSPHGLRRRRGALHYKRTGSLAEVAELLGDSKRVAEEHYVYALTDYREVDYGKLLGRVRTVRALVRTPKSGNGVLAGRF
jgi:integrase